MEYFNCSEHEGDLKLDPGYNDAEEREICPQNCISKGNFSADSLDIDDIRNGCEGGDETSDPMEDSEPAEQWVDAAAALLSPGLNGGGRGRGGRASRGDRQAVVRALIVGPRRQARVLNVDREQRPPLLASWTAGAHAMQKFKECMIDAPENFSTWQEGLLESLLLRTLLAHVG